MICREMKIGKIFLGLGKYMSPWQYLLLTLTCRDDLARFVEYILIFNNISYITYFNTHGGLKSVKKI